MVVYVEAVLLDNFCLDFLLGYLTLLLTKQKPRYLLIAIGAFLGSIFALVFPLIKSFRFVCKIVVLVVTVFFLSFKKTVRIFFVDMLVYLLLSFLLCGAFSFLLGGSVKDGFIGLQWGGAVGVCSVGIFFLVFSVRQIVGLIAERKRKEKYAVAEMINRDCSVKINALFDSGNLLTDENGEGVVVTDRRFAERLGALPSAGEMTVHTASGSKVLQLVKIPEIRIYSFDHENILTNVTAALSDLPDEYALILPCE